MAVTAESIARTCRSYWSPTDMVASSRNPGSGTNGTSEPIKFYKPETQIADLGGKREQIDKVHNQISFMC